MIIFIHHPNLDFVFSLLHHQALHIYIRPIELVLHVQIDYSVYVHMLHHLHELVVLAVVFVDAVLAVLEQVAVEQVGDLVLDREHEQHLHHAKVLPQ